ncbi:MAG: DJ-1/PfpI family protein [Legionellaceae bacterium]|nr:DJ-1/PfpI family protein [Legionellaceae bacterium]
MNITFLFYQGMTALDAIGPYEVLSRIPNASIQIASIQKGPINAGSGLILTAEYNLSEISATDVLLIPGSKDATSLDFCPDVLSWIKEINTTTIWTTSVCTGSLILGAAGLLKGLAATSHWAVKDRLQAFNAIFKDERVVIDGKIITAAGVSAGIDMALMLAEKLAGERIAKGIQLAIEYNPKPPFEYSLLANKDSDIRLEIQKRLKMQFK